MLLLHRLRALRAAHPRLAGAALLTVVAALCAAPLAGAAGMPLWAYGLVAAELLPLLWLRRRPFPVAIVVGVLAAVHSFTSVPEPVLPWSSLLCVYVVAATAPRRQALLTAAILAVVLPVVLLLDPGSPTVEGLLASSVVYAAAWLLGDATRHRRERAELLEERAVAAERARMAREMHDVLGHHLSLVVVQAEAGPALLRRSPGAAEAAFDAISDTGRQALQELRQVLGTLRGTPSPGRGPTPGVAALPELLDGVRRSGMTVEHVVTGVPVVLPAAGDRAAFRVVQEALTNAVKHAGSPAATVALRYTGRALEISVRNRGTRPVTGAGHGLLGMRERVTAVGGRFAAGPQRDGSWAVTAVIPAGEPS